MNYLNFFYCKKCDEYYFEEKEHICSVKIIFCKKCKKEHYENFIYDKKLKECILKDFCLVCNDYHDKNYIYDKELKKCILKNYCKICSLYNIRRKHCNLCNKCHSSNYIYDIKKNICIEKKNFYKDNFFCLFCIEYHNKDFICDRIKAVKRNRE